MSRGAKTDEFDREGADSTWSAPLASPRDTEVAEEGMEMDERGTGELFFELRKTDDLAGFLAGRRLGMPSLARYLNEKLAERGLRRSEVLREAQIEQTFGWYVFKGKRGMGRSNVIKLCLVMELDARETNRALQVAGSNALYPRVRRDAIIVWCLEHRVGLQRANEALYAFGEECLE